MRRLRSPFVVTAAVVASGVVACGDDARPPIANPPVADAERDSEVDAVTEPDVDAGAEANPSICPSADPGIGVRQTCGADPSIRCAYPDLCPSHPAGDDTNVYACKDDGTGMHWTLVSDPYTPPCPPEAPEDGAPCPCTVHLAYVACNYGVCTAEGATILYAACKGVDRFDPIWHVKPITCNPPEPDAGTLDAGDATAEADSPDDSPG